MRLLKRRAATVAVVSIALDFLVLAGCSSPSAADSPLFQSPNGVFPPDESGESQEPPSGESNGSGGSTGSSAGSGSSTSGPSGGMGTNTATNTSTSPSGGTSSSTPTGGFTATASGGTPAQTGQTGGTTASAAGGSTAVSAGGSTAKASGGSPTGGSTTTSTGGRATGGSTTTTTGGRATGGSAAASGGSATGGSATGGSATGGSPPTDCANFSFFVTSLAAMQRLSGSSSGFGGDLRYGQADGLAGADKICQDIATGVLACAGQKTWRAFLCTSAVDAIDRIGTGPWYDKNGYKVWSSTSEMTADRPPTSYTYRDDLPNEDGIPNHDYDMDGSTTDDDNHDFLTACGTNGRKISNDTAAQRCNDWTSTTASGTSTGGGGFGMMNGPMCGHSWPRQGSGTHWASSIREGGCGAGVNLQETGGATEATVGSGGGYGGIYCFALSP